MATLEKIEKDIIRTKAKISEYQQKISQKMTRSRSIFLPGTKNLQMHSVQRQAVHSSFLPKIFSEGSARRFRAKTS